MEADGSLEGEGDDLANFFRISLVVAEEAVAEVAAAVLKAVLDSKYKKQL